jgi:hypothetical protein
MIRSVRMRWVGHVTRRGGIRNVYKILVEKPVGKRPLGRHRRRWQDNIKMALKKTGWYDVDWVHPAQDSYRWRASGSIKGRKFLD